MVATSKPSVATESATGPRPALVVLPTAAIALQLVVMAFVKARVKPAPTVPMIADHVVGDHVVVFV